MFGLNPATLAHQLETAFLNIKIFKKNLLSGTTVTQFFSAAFKKVSHAFL